MKPYEAAIFHLEDLKDKITKDRDIYGSFFYDDYDGVDGNGDHELRNTEDLLRSINIAISALCNLAR